MPTAKPRVAKDGTRTWYVRFRHDGRETSETFHTIEAANVFLADYAQHGAEYAVDRRREDEDKATSPALDVVFASFITWKGKRVKSERTPADYERDYRNRIAKPLGKRPIGTIRDREVQALVDKWTDDGHSPKTIAGYHALLHAVVKYAMSNSGGRVLKADPCLETALPKRRKRAPKGFTPAEYQAFIGALRAIDPDAADVTGFLLASGWRWSEAVALDAWGCDDDGQYITVTMGRVLRRQADGSYVIVEDDGKADASMRGVKLDRAASAVVRARIASQGVGLVFRTKRGSTWHYSNFHSRVWKPAIKASGMTRKPTIHWLRHTHVGWMILRAGASMPELQSRIGHASIKTTIDVYGSMVTDVSTAALDAFGAFVTPHAHREHPA